MDQRDISALLDDELDASEASRAIDALRRDETLREAWSAYHLIGDTLRHDAAGYFPDISAKVMAQLSEGPVLLAPVIRLKPRPAPLRLALPLAAAVMGVAAVGWVALSLNAHQPAALVAKVDTAPPANETAAQLAQTAPPDATLKEYLLAHQAYSPTDRIQGVAPYIRTVSEIRQGGNE